MLRNFGYGGLALIGGAVTGIAISSWATPTVPPQVTPEVVRVASVVEPAMTFASNSSRVANDASNCSPWEVSDVAMEATLNEMIRRGWRPPSQAEAVATFEGPTVQSLEPESHVPIHRPASPAPDSSDEPPTEPIASFPVDQSEPMSEVAPAPVEAPGLNRPPRSLAPTIATDDSSSSSN